MTFVILGLGSNVGDRAHQLGCAVDALRAQVSELKASSHIETPALLPEGAPQEWDMPYLNMAVCGDTRLTPTELLRWVKALEQSLGRTARGHWGPREIDIDILAYGQEVVELPDLKIPHRGMLARAFALKPAAEIAPDYVHPLAKKTLHVLAMDL